MMISFNNDLHITRLDSLSDFKINVIEKFKKFKKKNSFLNTDIEDIINRNNLKKESVMINSRHKSKSIGNYPKEDKEKIKEILNKYSKKPKALRIKISNIAYDKNNNILTNYISLETLSINKEHSEFWKFFNYEFENYEKFKSEEKFKKVKKNIKKEENPNEINFGF